MRSERAAATGLRRAGALAIGLVTLAAAAAGISRAQERHPIYVGARACATCHDKAGSGHQYGRWLLMRHARAYESLATPEAVTMTRLSGLLQEPRRSPICLGCHAAAADAEPWERDPEFRLADGVQCEACHGPGSEYMDEAVMKDPPAASKAGLHVMTKQECQRCHYVKGSHVAVHGKPPLDVDKAWEAIAHRRPGGDEPDFLPETSAAFPPAPRPGPTSSAPLPVDEPTYKTPRNLAVRPDGAEAWVACEAASSVVIVDLRRRTKVAEIAVGSQPNDVAFSPDGRRAYVSNRGDDTVSVLDVAARRVTATIAVGDEPHGLITGAGGRRLYVINTSSGDVSVIDTATLAQVRRLPASRYPWSAAISADGSRLLVTNALSRFVPFREPSVSEITVIDPEGGRVVDRLSVPGTNLQQGIAWHPSGEFAFFTMNRTKNLVPMTRIQQGWTITNGLGIVWKDGRVDQVLLDEADRHFADAADVAFTPDGKRALVTSRGTDRVAVVDVERLLAILRRATDRERSEEIPDHLALATEFVTAYVETGDAPSGVAVTPDGRTALVASSLDDSLTLFDPARPGQPARVDLGGPEAVTTTRRGERLFHSAGICFERQFSCSSCHPDGHVDGLTYDIEADGIGVSPVDNRTLRGILDTDPFKWEGTNPSLARQCGSRLAVFFTRIQPFTPEELAALNLYTVTIPRPPNRHRAPGAELTPAQARGRVLFFRTTTNDRRVIPIENRCSTCHFPPYYTDRSKRDVGTRMRLDRQGTFDVPHLNNIYDSAPYLHNGIAETLEEIWTRYNPGDAHGVTNDMTKDQLNDLIEFLKTL